MSTYSINTGSPTQTTFRGNLDPNLFLNLIENNTSENIKPEDVRDALYTLWENTTYKIVSTSGSSYSYIGINGINHKSYYESGADGLKMLIGKPSLSGTDVLSEKLLGYNSADPTYPDSDLYIYNFKPDDFGGGGSDQQFTKVSFLAGDINSLTFSLAPYVMATNIGNGIDFHLVNEGGKIVIDSDEIQIGNTNSNITFLYGTESGILNKPAGSIGDIQTNLDGCSFSFINGASASVGNILIMGASNSPYWGTLSIDSVFTLSQVLSAGNTSNGEDLILTNTSSLYIGGTGGSGSSHSVVYFNGTYSLIENFGELRVVSDKLRFDITGVGSNKALYTDSLGYAYWGTQSSATPGGSSDSIQFNNSGTFSGSNLLKWSPSFSSLDINNTGTTYSLNVKANTEGGLYLNTNGRENGIRVNDGSNDIILLNSSDKELYLDMGNSYSTTFGGTVSQGKYTFYQGTVDKDLVLYPNSGSNSFKMLYKNSSGTQSYIDFSRDNIGGLFMGNSEGSGESVVIGDYTGSSYNISMLVSSSTYSMSNILNRTSSKVVILGDSFTHSITPGKILRDSDSRSFGINIAPEVDFELYGVKAISPTASTLLTNSLGSISLALSIESSYLTLDTIDDAGTTITRIGDFSSGKVTSFGTTIDVWNRTGGDLLISTLNSEISNGSYNETLGKNIYFPDEGISTPSSVISWNTSTMMRFVYLEINGDIRTNILSMSNNTQLIEESGVWYRVY